MGMMPTRELGQNRADPETSIGKPDGSIGSGTQLLASKYVGKTAAAMTGQQDLVHKVN